MKKMYLLWHNITSPADHFYPPFQEDYSDMYVLWSSKSTQFKINGPSACVGSGSAATSTSFGMFQPCE